MPSLLVGILVGWASLLVLIVAAVWAYGSRRDRDGDRYALTQLAEEIEEDPLETWYSLDPDGARLTQRAESQQDGNWDAAESLESDLDELRRVA